MFPQTFYRVLIDALYNYCLRWNLTVNLNKSKIMIFRRATRISKHLKLHFSKNGMDIITFSLSFKKHLVNRFSVSKLAINTSWIKYINHTKLSKSNKLKIFQSASRSVMFYALQVCGYANYGEVQKLFRFFIQKKNTKFSLNNT